MGIKNKGISLIEVMVSVFIAAFIFVAMMRLYSLGSIQTELARHKTMAINLAQAEIENLKNVTYENIDPAVYPLTRIVKIDPGKTSQAADDMDGTMTTAVSSVAEGYKVIVTVAWNDYYGMISEVLESVIASY
jgi:Tfp pilus assembly protein PilV